MDISTITAVGGLLVAAAGVSVAVFGMDLSRRIEWIAFWKRWLTVSFVILIAANSVIGIYLFAQGPAQLTRSDTFNLALHLFNLLSLPVIWFIDAVGKAMDERSAKRVELSEAVQALTRQVEAIEHCVRGHHLIVIEQGPQAQA